MCTDERVKIQVFDGSDFSVWKSRLELYLGSVDRKYVLFKSRPNRVYSNLIQKHECSIDLVAPIAGERAPVSTVSSLVDGKQCQADTESSTAKHRSAAETSSANTRWIRPEAAKMCLCELSLSDHKCGIATKRTSWPPIGFDGN